ncbi:MAG: AI-2E family transporter, partial [Chloroflexota bacterium]
MADQPVDIDSRSAEPTVGTAELIPSWLDNLSALSWRVIVIVALLVVFWFLSTLIWTVTASIALTIVIAAVLAPFVLRLRAGGRSRTAAAGIVWLIALLVGIGLLLLLVISFLPFVVELVSQVGAGTDELKVRLEELQLPAWLGAMVVDAFGSFKAMSGEAVSAIVGSVASAVGVLVLTTFLLFFFLRDGDKAWLWFFQDLGEEKRERITTAGDDALARVGGYLRGTTVLALIYAVSSYAFMWLLGVPLAGPLALLTFVAAYIPYFGSVVTSGIILLVTLEAVSVEAALIMLALITVRAAAVTYLVRPAIYGRTVSIHPALVLIVLPAGLQLAGLVGLIAAVPLTAVVLAVGRATVSIIEPDPRPRLPVLVPAWLDRAAQWGWRLLVAIGLMALLVLILTTIPLVVIPVMLGLIFAATLEPIAKALERRGHSRGRATGIAVGGTALTIVAVLALTMVSLVAQAPELGDTVIDGAESLDESAGGQLGLLVEALQGGVTTTLDTIVSVTQSLATSAAVVVLSTLLAFYFMRDGGRQWARAMAHARPGAAAQLNAAASEAYGVLGGYMTGTAAISFVGAASQYVIMVVLGLPLGLPVFVLSFFGGFIPYIGGFITTMIAFLVA